MNLIDELLSPLGGTNDNNLNNALHLDKSLPDDIELIEEFRLTPYHDLDTISSYQTQNSNSINIMSLNAESIFAKINQLEILIKTLYETHNLTVHVISIQEA